MGKIINFEVQGIMEAVKIDVICPIFYVNLAKFETFLQNWYHNIPIRKLIIGLGKNDERLITVLSKFPNILIIDQTQHKTLGFCLQELFETVETDWFIYLHNDVELTPHWFEKIWDTRMAGIVESQKDPSFGSEAKIQAKKRRGYSGAQLIFKKCVENLGWQDDYIYCSEEIILRNVIEHRGFSYLKYPIYHIHHRDLAKRTQPRDIILEWQFKAILKYCYPEEHLMSYIKSILNTLSSLYNRQFDLEKEIIAINPKWLEFYS